jgi:hypothetical protein
MRIQTFSTKRIKCLNIQPLSVVKYFYEEVGERALDPAFIQPIIYLVYNEVLKKENSLLFAEEFETNESTPFLSSLDKLLENEKQLLRELNKTKDINNSLVIKYLERISRKHNNDFACELQFKARSNGGRRLTIR